MYSLAFHSKLMCYWLSETKSIVNIGFKSNQNKVLTKKTTNHIIVYKYRLINLIG